MDENVNEKLVEVILQASGHKLTLNLPLSTTILDLKEMLIEKHSKILNTSNVDHLKLNISAKIRQNDEILLDCLPGNVKKDVENMGNVKIRGKILFESGYFEEMKGNEMMEKLDGNKMLEKLGKDLDSLENRLKHRMLTVEDSYFEISEIEMKINETLSMIKEAKVGKDDVDIKQSKLKQVENLLSRLDTIKEKYNSNNK